MSDALIPLQPVQRDQVNHELRQDLQTIMAAAETMITSLLLDDENRERARAILTAAKRQGSTISRLFGGGEVKG